MIGISLQGSLHSRRCLSIWWYLYDRDNGPRFKRAAAAAGKAVLGTKHAPPLHCEDDETRQRLARAVATNVASRALRS